MRWGSAVIFAGGKSSRMGIDKALLPFGGFGTLAEYQYHRLGKWFDHVHISTKEDKFPFEAITIKDKYFESSPMVALASSLESIDDDEIFIISVDMPFLDKRLIARLYDRYMADKDIEVVVPSSSDGLEPLCGIYSKRVLNRAEDLVSQNKHRMKDLLDICSTDTIKCDRDGVFVNLNTHDDYLVFHGGTDAKY